MSRRLALAVGVLLLTVGAAAAAVLLSSSTVERGEPVPEIPADEAFVVVAEVSPPIHRFGDPVVARLQVAIDRRRADPERSEVNAQFAPYESAGPVSVGRRDVADVTVLIYEYPLNCLATACLSLATATQVDVPEALIAVFRTDIGRKVEARVRWPTLTVAARASSGDAVAIPVEATLDELPGPTYRIDPETLRWLATSLAAALIIGLGIWAALALRPRLRTAAVGRAAPEGSDPVAQALERLDRIDGEPTPVRRAALETLAHALEDVDGATLVPEARRLAWSQEAPAKSEIDAFAAAVRRKLGDAA